jgi:hypothetical protein
MMEALLIPSGGFDTPSHVRQTLGIVFVSRRQVDVILTAGSHSVFSARNLICDDSLVGRCCISNGLLRSILHIFHEPCMECPARRLQDLQWEDITSFQVQENVTWWINVGKRSMAGFP